MPSDLTELFDRFRREPLATVLAGPEALRHEGSRRRRIRRAATAGLAAGAVAAVAVALAAVLPTPLGLIPPPPPGIIGSSTSTTAVPTPTRTTDEPSPTPTETGSAEPTSLIPDTAFPSGIELRFEDGPGQLLPEACGLVNVETPLLLASRSRGSYIDVPDPPDQLAPEGSMGVQVLLYAEGGASEFMESVRAAVTTCRSDPNWMEGMYGPLSFAAILDGPVYGDETFTFTASHQSRLRPDSDETYTCSNLYEVVRVGDAVHVADVVGWETCYADPTLDRRLRDSAIDAFVAWALTL